MEAGEKGEFTMKDDLSALRFFEETWKNFDGSLDLSKKLPKQC